MISFRKEDKLFLTGGSMGNLIKSFPWSDHPLGPISLWPQSLIITVNTMLHSPIPMIVLWGQDGFMIYNDAYSIFAGQKHPYLLGKKVLDGWPEVAEFNKNVMETVLQGKPLTYQDQQLTLFRNNIAEEVWMDLTYSAIINEEEQPVGVLAIVIDTTEKVNLKRKQIDAENEFNINQIKLKNSEEHLKALITATSDVIYLMNPDWSEMGTLEGNIFVPNDGRPRNEWFDTNIPKEEQPFVRRAIDEAINKKQIFQLEHRVNLADGNIGWTFSRAIPILNENHEIIKWFGAASDITIRKNSEESLLERNKQLNKINNDLDNFIYIASHDLKTPMCNIEGLIIALRGNLKDEEVVVNKETEIILQLMENSINRFKSTIFGLTEISKVQNVKLQDESEIQLSELVEDVKMSIIDKIVESKASIKTDFSIVNSLNFSRKNLKSIMYNLISNAIKYRDQLRTPEIFIKTESEGIYTKLIIKDNGLGMENTHGKLFTMFKRFHDHVEGTGIGLYIVKRILDNAEGKVEVESVQGEGTTFKIYFKNK